MALACAGTPEGLIVGLLAGVDCNVQAMTAAAYGALSGPDSKVGLALTLMMTLYVGLLGLRLMLGLAPLRIGDLTLTALKLGLVLALATNWPAYQQVVFRTLFDGPSEVASTLLRSASPGGGDPFAVLQVAFDQMQRAASFFVRVGPPGGSPLTGGSPFAAFAVNTASYLMLLSTLGVVLAAKTILALLLGLGPLFVAMLLFDVTRGVFEGWLRASLAFALAPLFATFALVVQLLLVSPQLAALDRMQETSVLNLPAASALFLLTVIAAMVSAAGLIGVGLIAAGFRLPHSSQTRRQDSAGLAASGQPSAAESSEARSRAAGVAAAAAAMERRDLRLEQQSYAPDRRALAVARPPDAAGRAPPSPGQRSAQPPKAVSSQRRDR